MHIVFQFTHHREEGEAGTLLDTKKKGGRGDCANAQSRVGLKGNVIMKPVTKYGEHNLVRNRRKESPLVASQLQTGSPTPEKHQPGENKGGILGLRRAPEDEDV